MAGPHGAVPGAPSGLKVRVLGSLEVIRDGVTLPPSPPGQRAVLGLLALAQGEPVRQDAAIELLWGDRPPRSAVGVFQTYVSRLRAWLRDSHQQYLLRDSAGYRLHVTEEHLDALAFRSLVRQARDAVTAEAARHLYEQAMVLWRGDPLEDVPALRAHPKARALQAERTEATLAYAELAAANGWHDGVLPLLLGLAARDPLDERSHAALMVALAGSDKQAEALQVYEDLRRRLDEELAVLPGAGLRAAHEKVLRQEVAAGRITSSESSWQPVFQLPAAPSDFTGRSDELARIREVISGDGGVPIMAICGQPGIGKTTLAVHAAHQARDRFPDGQLWVELAGASARPREPGEVLGELLRALGVPGFAIPGNHAERVVAFRSTIAGRRLLIIADDAASAEQAAPLLPGTPGCALIVTSRMSLEGLVGADLMPLDVMPRTESASLLTRLVGPKRAGAEPGAVDALAEACGDLPLALRIVGARLAARPAWPVSLLTRRLVSAHGRLPELEAGALSVRAGIATSYGLMPGRQRRAFRLLSSLGPADFAEWVVPVLLGEPGSTRVLDDLVSRSMVIPAGVDTAGEPRYRLHDLLRDFAAERLDEEPSDGQAALGRLLAAYLQLAALANDRLPPEPFFPPVVIEVRPGILPPALAEQLAGTPIPWFTAERINLLAAVQTAGENGLHVLARQLAACQSSFQHLQDRQEDAERMWRSLSDSARLAGDGADQEYADMRIGGALIQRGRAAEALPILERCVSPTRAKRDPEFMAFALYWRGFCALELDEYPDGRLHGEQGLLAARQAKSPVAEVMNMRLLGNVLAWMGEGQLALTMSERAYEASVGLGSGAYRRTALHTLANVCTLVGEHERAIGLCLRAEALGKELGDIRGQALSQGLLADAYRGLGQLEAAAACLRRALPVFREHHARRFQALCLMKLGLVYEEMGSAEAIQFLEESLTIFYELGLKAKASVAEEALARWRAAHG